MKKLILTLSLALALTMTASAKTLVVYFSWSGNLDKVAKSEKEVRAWVKFWEKQNK